MQTKNTHSFRQGNFRGWKSCFGILLALPLLTLLIYFGYCWGLWGRQSLLLQYLFQCKCPPTSEEARYPKSVDIIVPACSYLGSLLSPSGNLLYVHEGKSRFADTYSASYLVDFRTNEKIPFFIGKGSIYFLTDDLLFLSLSYGQAGYEGGEYILDRTTGKKYPIQPFIFLRDDTLYANGELNLEVLTLELQSAQDLYLIDNDTIVALKSDFRTSPEHSFYFDQGYLPGYDPDRGQQFLQKNGIDYRTIPEAFQEEAISPDGRFIARLDGIYLADGGEKIVDAYLEKGLLHSYGKYFSLPRGWTSDSSGVIYSKALDSCLLELPSYDGGTCSVSVRQPLIKLKVPEEFLPQNEQR